ncbi:MAG TPA: alpha/beta hydrolase [Alphaproteobacteria bacterium]|nr:alpha/beta hydrolase [Alphaproteobacteria bacterium]
MSPERGPVFVLVHGAFHGGWCWRAVADRLTRAGARVFAPTCTGLGERAHLLTRDITHETFVQDVVGVIEAEELEEVILVGHSFGGVVISGVADRLPERLRHLVYLDSVIPPVGRAPIDILPREVAAARIRAAEETSGGLTIPVPTPGMFGVPDGPLADWMDRRLTPQPLASYTTPFRLAGPIANGRPRTYVLCTDPIYQPVSPTYEWVVEQKDWPLRKLPACHDAMITEPGLVADLLLERANQGAKQ